MNELALFAGAGGGLLAGQLLGWTTVGAVELEPYPASVLRQRQLDGCLDPFPIWDDVRTFGREQLDWMTSIQQEHETMAGKPKKMSNEAVVEALQLYEGGMSIADVAHLYDVTRQALHERFKSRGYKPRPQLRYKESNHFYRQGKRADREAQRMVEHAVAMGELTPPYHCERCGDHPQPFRDGRRAIQAHHCDYNKPLDVMWLCQPCHHEWHKNNKPIAKEGGWEPVHIDVVSGGFP